MKYSRGDIVDFIGTRYYTRPNGKVFFTVTPGVAKVIAAMDAEVQCPYRLAPIVNGKTTVNGWVSEKDIIGIHKKYDIEDVTFDDSEIVKICYAKVNKEEKAICCENWSDKNWIAACRPRNFITAGRILNAARKMYAEQIIPKTEKDFVKDCLEEADIFMEETMDLNGFIRTGLFNCLTSKYYTKEAQYLRRGDILLGEDYFAIVLSSGINFKKAMIPIKTDN